VFGQDGLNKENSRILEEIEKEEEDESLSEAESDFQETIPTLKLEELSCLKRLQLRIYVLFEIPRSSKLVKEAL